MLQTCNVQEALDQSYKTLSVKNRGVDVQQRGRIIRVTLNALRSVHKNKTRQTRTALLQQVDKPIVGQSFKLIYTRKVIKKYSETVILTPGH